LSANCEGDAAAFDSISVGAREEEEEENLRASRMHFVFQGTSGSKEELPGTSGSKETQWASCGRFGEKGNEQTYESTLALAKALERSSSRSGMSRALRVAKQKAPSSALRVYFRYAGLELVWYKESGEN
jgi:hypothetical protein